MRKETILKAQAALPATRPELAARLAVGQQQAGRIARHLVANRFAEEWGTRITSLGTLAPILHATEKKP